jgi:hypothetical protein
MDKYQALSYRLNIFPGWWGELLKAMEEHRPRKMISTGVMIVNYHDDSLEIQICQPNPPDLIRVKVDDQIIKMFNDILYNNIKEKKSIISDLTNYILERELGKFSVVIK